MKTASAELIALLATRQFFAVDLYEFVIVDFNDTYYYRFCTGDQDIIWNGHTWSAGGKKGPFINKKGNRAKCKWKAGLEVDEMTFDFIPGTATLTSFGTVTFADVIKNGYFDGAELNLYRAYMPTYGNTAAGTVLLFAGRIGAVRGTRSCYQINVVSHLELLDQNMPRNLCQGNCVNTLYDEACGLNKNSWDDVGTITDGSTNTNLYFWGVDDELPSNWFDLGFIYFLTGPNNGLARTIKSFTQGTPAFANLVSPFPYTPELYDVFRIYAGCDKTQLTCQNKFENLENFRGFPYVPENSTAI